MRKLHIIARQKAYLNTISNQLLEIFGDSITLSSTTVQDMTKDLVLKNDIVVLSKEVLIGITRPFIPETCPVILAKREVNIVATKKLLSLPKKQQILIINDTSEHAVETVNSLRNIFFEHEYSAYDSISSIEPTTDWIVTPGEIELVPKGFTNVIDIGPRIVDFNTVLEISSCLDMNISQASLMNRFFKSQLVVSEKYNNEQYLINSMDSNDGHSYDYEDKVHKNIETQKKHQGLKEMSSMIEKIEVHGFLDESLAILRIYQSGKKELKSFGRTKVKSRLLDMGINLTDQQLRLRLEILHELGLVNVQKGRGGTKLSDKGEVFLDFHQSTHN
ncbi:hypothetical protein ACQKDD_07190 [Planococcus kocurii]|uniref:Uncharacterized protein n=1 Tax=Planococcus kocurii TaxID=1374 RepID=A0ABM5WZ25_9BACL|nr:hypothetical protein [Planococcus kocurii]ALS79589.1 hypothetical protein AUO94_13565 [Planococcus kocurii]